jgi:hypothetical protein
MVPVDLIVLSRDFSPLRPDVRAGIQVQRDVDLTVHRISGPARREDPHRWATIARARNQAKGVGFRPWVMLLDDDVVLGRACLATLVQSLQRRGEFAALAADSAGEMEMNRGWQHWDYPSHVGMAAILFRRPHLAGLTFRWEPDRCECLCCCHDLRAAGLGIGYQPGALAWHRPVARTPASAEAPSARGRVLAAFDRRDVRRFITRFLPTLRRAGNDEEVWAHAYGLYPGELDRLRAEASVHVLRFAHDGVSPALRRLRDFQQVLAAWPQDTPVAYWDAGDVLFQGRLQSLWDAAAAHPDRLLVAPDALSYPQNHVIKTWCDHIRDPDARRHAFQIMSSYVFLNSGFAAGTAGTLLRYLRCADQLLHSPALDGVGDWGDQPALNLYCHSNPERWREISPSWNFTLAGRDSRTYRMRADGWTERLDGEPVHVVHGNARTLRWLELSRSATV